MESKYVHSINGQEHRQQDINSASENAALADDRVLWELFRALPYGSAPDKLIIPFAMRNWSKLTTSYGATTATSTALVWGNSSDAKVHVGPFRAILGSTTVIGTSPIESMRGGRSGYLIGTSNFWQELTITANSSGNPRWDLIYAAVAPDANGDTADVLVKSPTTSVVATAAATVINRKTAVTIGRVQGTPAGSPTRPALPSDGGGSYYIALAHVWVENGFGAGTAVARSHIYEVAPCALPTTAAGFRNMAPANHQYTHHGSVDTNQSGESSATRPGAYLPSTMVGSESRTILLQLRLSPASHLDGDVIDDSIDWRFRYFKWQIAAKGGNTTADAFASDRAATGVLPAGSVFANAAGSAHGVNSYYGHGQSFIGDSANGIASANDGGVALFVHSTNMGSFYAGGGGSAIQIYVRSTDGALVYKQLDEPRVQVIIWLDASAPYSNYSTV
jgi:hypothetical protein